jgi:hypothetical protein
VNNSGCDYFIVSLLYRSPGFIKFVFFLWLSDAEAQAIAYHDGMYVPEGRSVAHREEPLLLLLHIHEKFEPATYPHGEYFRKPEDAFMVSAVYHYGNDRRKRQKK